MRPLVPPAAVRAAEFNLCACAYGTQRTGVVGFDVVEGVGEGVEGVCEGHGAVSPASKWSCAQRSMSADRGVALVWAASSTLARWPGG
jgi:hypothetical protein